MPATIGVSRPLRLLFITPWLPYPAVSGFRTRVSNIMRELARHHHVTLLSYARPEEAPDVAALTEMLADVRVVPRSRPLFARKRSAQLRSLAWRRSYQSGRLWSRTMQGAIDRILAERDFDIVQLESSMLGIFTYRTLAPIVLDEHNIEYELFRRTMREERSPARKLFNLFEYVKFRREERAAWRRADAVVFTSARERAIFGRLMPDRTVLEAANGVDTAWFRPAGTPAEPDCITFTGLMSYRPNVDAVTFFVRDVLPLVQARRPNVRFVIAGADPQADVLRLAGPGVAVTGRLPDMRPEMARAAVLVVPLRFGSGTRLKVLEGLAMGRPIVSTPLGYEGIDVRDGTHVLSASDAPAFAAAVVRVLEDGELAARLGSAGRALVEERYAWPAIAARLERFYEGLAPSPVPPRWAALPEAAVTGG